jgi:signal transduction histidine kinase
VVHGPDGKFSGAVQVGVEVSEIAEVFSQIDLGQHGQLALYRVQDGVVVARHPMTEAQLNESIATLPFFSAIANSPDSSWAGVVRMGDQDRILSARRVHGLPLIVVASIPKTQVYAGAWYRLLWHSIVAAGILTVLAGLTFGAIRRVKKETRDHLLEILQLNRQLAHTNRVTIAGELSASIAHELNQPLAAIVINGGAGLRFLAADNPEEVQSTLKRIVSDGHRAGEIIKNLRAMFKKDSQQKTYLNINEVIREVLSLSPGDLQRKSVFVELQLNAGLPQVLADRVQLQQVLLNLIVNAVDAMASVQDRARKLRIETKVCEPHSVLVTVEDTGSGIDPANVARIFDGFFTTKSGGMGMGLAICKSIIEAHGGRISASGGHPYGSTFQIILPSGARGNE